MLTRRLTKCFIGKRHCSNFKGVYCPRYKMCETIEKCTQEYRHGKCDKIWTSDCDKSTIDKLSMMEVYCPAGCNNIKSECKHVYGRQCNFILRASTDEEMKDFLTSMKRCHDWSEKERNSPGSTMGPY